MNTRVEEDSMGQMPVPAAAYYGASTARAVENFPISGIRFNRSFIEALGMIKAAAAQVNRQQGKLTVEQSRWIEHAAEEVVASRWDSEFVVDVFQTGSGTSTNMNANEVIASRANEMATGQRGGKHPVHPNDHVNMGQSSNDVIPTTMHIAAGRGLKNSLAPAMEYLAAALSTKAVEFDDVVKIGRTHLQDATPVRLGQEFSGYARQASLAVVRCEKGIHALCELPLGGTAVGTGINSTHGFARDVIAILKSRTGIGLVEAVNHFEAQAAKDAIVEVSGQLKAIAVSLTKIANDIRWLASGPRCGLGEISLLETQPGSSIMPGKVNPVMSEMVLQVCAQVIGNDAAITWAAGMGSNFELNVMMPVMTRNLLESIDLLSRAARVFADRAVMGIRANRDRCQSLVEQSLAMCTSLVPVIGYDRSAKIARESFESGRTIREIATELNVTDPGTLAEVLDARRMTEPGRP